VTCTDPPYMAPVSLPVCNPAHVPPPCVAFCVDATQRCIVVEKALTTCQLNCTGLPTVTVFRLSVSCSTGDNAGLTVA